MILKRLAAALLLAGALTACGGNTKEADEAAIRDQNKKWLEAIVAKDASAIANIYAEDGAMLPPNAAKLTGRESIKAMWTDLVKIPGFALTFESQNIVLARSGDLAVDTQTYKLVTGEGASQTTEVGKGVVTWTKRNGQWLVLTDMFSSDTPPPMASPVPPPPLDATPVEPATEAAPTTPAAPAPTPVTPPAQ